MQGKVTVYHAATMQNRIERPNNYANKMHNIKKEANNNALTNIFMRAWCVSMQTV